MNKKELEALLVAAFNAGVKAEHETPAPHSITEVAEDIYADISVDGKTVVFGIPHDELNSVVKVRGKWVISN